MKPAISTDQPLLLHGIALTGLIVALFGTYWDDAWHTDIGRDTFWSPPHIFLYAGIALAGASIGARALRRYLETRSIRGVLETRGLAISIVGVGATMLSAPIDETWHVLYGRDAVAWSPPHLLGLVGVLLLVGGIQLDVRRATGPGSAPLRVLADASVLATLLALVFEYDSDVPQFDEVWYLPVMTLAMALAFGLARRSHPRGLPVLSAASAYTALMVVTIFALLALGHSQPIVPAVIVPALAYDVAARRRATLPVRALALVLATWLAYQPYLNLLDGVRLDMVDVLIGLPLSFLAAGAGLALTDPPRPARISQAVAATLALIAFAPTALAHDPGQGEPVADITLRARQFEDEWDVYARVEGLDCDAIEPRSAFARRADETIEGRIHGASPCMLNATFELPEASGRWFGYVRFRDATGILEAWIPLEPADIETTKTTTLYRPTQTRAGAAQIAGSIALYSTELALVGFFLHRARRADASS